MNMNRNNRKVHVRFHGMEDGTVWGRTNDEFGAFVSGDSIEDAKEKMAEIIRAYGAFATFMNVIDLFENDRMGRNTLPNSVVKYEMAQ